MKTGGFRFARDEEPVGFVGHPQFEGEKTIAWLMNFLNAGSGQDGSKFAEHTANLGGGQ